MKCDIPKMIGDGAEAVVFSNGNNIGSKIFDEEYIIDISMIPNKEKKCKILKDIKIERISFPIDLIYNQSGVFEGYTLPTPDLMPSYPYCKTFEDIFDAPLSIKVEFLQKLEELFCLLHSKTAKYELAYVDFRNSNFLIDLNSQVWIVDTDSMQVGPYKTDILPAWPKFYQKNFNGEFNIESDKFLYGLYALYILIGESFFINPNTGIKSKEFLKKIVNNLYIPKYLKEIFIEVFYTTGSKPYFYDALDSIADDKQKKLQKPLYIYSCN